MADYNQFKDLGATLLAVKTLLVDATGAAIDTSAAGADGASNTQNQLRVAARENLFNGTTWDRRRGTEERELLHRTIVQDAGGNTDSANQINYNHLGIMLIVNFVSIGAGAQFNPSIRGIDPSTGGSYLIHTAPTIITAAGRYIYVVYPGASLAGISGGITNSYSGVCPRNFFVRLAAATAGLTNSDISTSIIMLP